MLPPHAETQGDGEEASNSSNEGLAWGCQATAAIQACEAEELLDSSAESQDLSEANEANEAKTVLNVERLQKLCGEQQGQMSLPIRLRGVFSERSILQLRLS